MASAEDKMASAGGDVTEYDVVVVGAGVAGLTTAKTLLKADPQLKVLLLEARDRVGGRTFTQAIKVRGGKVGHFDLGAQWVGPTQHHILEVINELGLEIIPQYCEGTKVMQLGGPKVKTFEAPKPTIGSLWALAETKIFMWKLERMVPLVPMSDPYSSPLAHELEAMTVAAYSSQHLWTAAARDYMDQCCKGCFGTDASRIGMLFFLAYANASGSLSQLFGIKDTAQEYRLKTGTQPISLKMADIVGHDKIQLTQAVTAVHQVAEERILVTHQKTNLASNTLEGAPSVVAARRVVMTVPPNLLGRVNFNPPLSSLKKDLCETLQMGHLYKFIVTYEKAHWREKGYSGEVFATGSGQVTPECTTTPLCECYDISTAAGEPAVVGFFAGRSAVEWRGKTKQERETAVIACLVEYLGPEMGTYIAYEDKMWGDDPWAGGCPVTYGTPGTLFALPHIRTPHGGVHFGGTETATLWMGYMSGAVQSGHRVALEVLAALRPSLLTKEQLKEARQSRTVRAQFIAQPPRTVSRALLTAVAAAALGVATYIYKREEVLQWMSRFG